ncbi:cytochrome P450 [Sphingomonas sp. G-3-2-10]|uniref:cytochrome P450 n=1 Tax=Sphingomonas sp. G-3-2-10 TaxID=2728838 RepID=UPI00146D67E3|nr:cytochrome P450 [Sphingomonas sp. G-3-2-10]NML05806.1 cytochrome P450 [Sphingomonas sp. G-3-2-10]
MVQAALSPAAPKPAHVADDLVYDFDVHADPGLLADPHARLLDLLKTAPPVFWTPRNGGGWIVLSHAANYEASRNTEVFSSEFMPPAQMKAMLAALPPGAPHIPTPVPITLDPPEHTKYRQPLQKVFSPKTIANLRESIRELAGALIDGVKADGGCEFMSAIAEPLPVQVFLKMLGLPLDRQAEYREIVSEHMKAIDGDRVGSMKRLQRIAAAMRDTLLERKANPQDDIISMLWALEIDGQPTTLADMENYGVLLFIAGLDTVMNGMGLAMRGLALDQELQAKLRAEPKLINEAAEEMLRRYTFTVPVRIIKQEAEIHGATMKPGDIVKLFLPAADLDAREFPQPDKYELGRENNVHIAFGVGPHRCLGSHLARVELQVLYEEMLARLPAFRLDPANPPIFHGGHVIGIERMHLLWDA